MNLIHPVISNWKELMLKLAAGMGANVIDEPGFFRMITGLPDAVFNPVGLTRLAEAEAERRIAETVAIARERRIPVEYWVAPDSKPEDLDVLLVNAGFEFAYEVPAMVIEGLGSWPRTGEMPNLTYRVAVTDEVLGDLRVPFSVYGLSSQTIDALIHCIPLMRDSFVQLVGYEDGVAVCAGAVQFGGGEAGIYNIGTVAEARGRGLGTAVTCKCLSLSKERGYDTAVLTSSPQGFRVYESLGFEHVFSIPHYRFDGRKG